METKFEWTTNCVCVKYDDETGEPMLNEYGNEIPADVCSDWCHIEQAEQFEEFIQPWLDSLTTGKVIIKGSNMNWNHVTGWKGTEFADAEGVMEALGINSDYTLRFTLAGNTLTCVRSSHDELGAFFEFVELPAELAEEVDF